MSTVREREREREKAKVMARLAIYSMLLITINFPSLAITASIFLSLPINFASAGNYLDDQPAADLVHRKSFLHSCMHFYVLILVSLRNPQEGPGNTNSMEEW